MKFCFFPVLLVFAVFPTVQAQERSQDDQAHVQPKKKQKPVNQDDQARRFYQKYLSLQPNGRYASDAKRGIAQIDAILGK
jgi:hypothetical protein